VSTIIMEMCTQQWVYWTNSYL